MGNTSTNHIQPANRVIKKFRVLMDFALCEARETHKKTRRSCQFCNKIRFRFGICWYFHFLIAIALLRMYIDEGCSEKLLSCSEKSYSKEVNLDGARVVQQILDSEGKVSAGVLVLLLFSLLPSLKYCFYIFYLRQYNVLIISGTCRK